MFSQSFVLFPNEINWFVRGGEYYFISPKKKKIRVEPVFNSDKNIICFVLFGPDAKEILEK